VRQHLSRRGFMRGLPALFVLLMSPLAGAADAPGQGPPWRIGVLLVAWAPLDKQPQELRQRLRDAGYVEGRDVVIEWRSAEGNYDRVFSLAADLVQQKVDVIVVDSTPAALAAKRATSAIPIVMVISGDPVGSGLVASLARPGGNVTGLSMMMSDLGAKRLQLLKEMLPRVRRVALIWDPTVPWHKSAVENLKAAARTLSIQTEAVRVSRKEEFGSAFSAIRRSRAEAVYVLENAFFVAQRGKLLKLSSDAGLPLVYGQKEFAEDGALMSYSANFDEMWRKAAGYVDKILKGAKPADLPIEQPTTFELVVNLKTAKALGIKIPESILLRADQVIR
jgi:putative ABC transport system substrate-binding protein